MLDSSNLKGPQCPEKGIAWLTHVTGERIAVATTCKRKTCRACRSKVKARFQMLVEYGILTQECLYFITLTLRAVESTMRDAEYVAVKWRRLLEWFRVRYPKGT